MGDHYYRVLAERCGQVLLATGGSLLCFVEAITNELFLASVGITPHTYAKGSMIDTETPQRAMLWVLQYFEFPVADTRVYFAQQPGVATALTIFALALMGIGASLFRLQRHR